MPRIHLITQAQSFAKDNLALVMQDISETGPENKTVIETTGAENNKKSPRC